MDEYSNINTATLGTEYLMTNATTHSFIFGAMAELVDNARDAGSSTLEIYTEAGNDRSSSPLLCFKDDGCGMSKEEADNVIVFGSSKKTDQEEPIGMYGNGLKSGSMRLGQDMVLFTKHGSQLTCLMISRTFFKAENVTQIKVPAPTFDAKTRAMFGTDKKKHSIEVDLIRKYSPFRTEEAILEQFDKIASPTGTLVVIYNLCTTAAGDLELDFTTDPHDIRTNIHTEEDQDSDLADVKERTSFRAYASILYKSPRMKIMLQGKRVRTRLLAYSLYLPKRITVNYKSFKNQSEKLITEAKKQIDVTKRKLTEIQSQISNLNKTSAVTNKNNIIQLRKLQTAQADLTAQLSEKKGIMELRKKQAKKSEQLEFYFGLNANERYHDGMFFYNADRLIKMYVKEGTLQSKEEITYRGIIAVVSVPKSSLLPTHNKQDFNDHAEYKKLRKCVDQAMQQYWEDVVMGEWIGIQDGWALLGYTQDWRKPPSEEEEYKIRRARLLKHLQQCDKCLKWRVIPYHKNYLYKDFPDDWQCANSLDPSTNNCSKPEALPKIESSPLKPKTQLKAAAAEPSKKETLSPAASKRMSAAAQEQKKLEEKKKRAEAEVIYKSAQKRSKSFIHEPSLKKPKQSARPSTDDIAFATSQSATSARKSRKRTSSPETPPLRTMRRPSPSRVIRNERTPSPAPVTAAAPGRRRNVSKLAAAATASSEVQNVSDAETDASTSSSTHTPLQAVVKTEDQNGVNGTAQPHPKKWRLVTIQDLNDELISPGMVVQGRLQNKWQEAEVIEVRPDNVLVKFKNKTSLAMKVKNPDKNQPGELKMQSDEGDEEMETESSSTTLDEQSASSSTQYSAIHLQKLLSIIKLLDRNIDADSLSPSNLADLDLNTLLTRYSSKVKEDSVASSKSDSIKAIAKLKEENKTLEVKVKALQKQVDDMEAKWEKRELDRFERIRVLFSQVLRVCIGSGPESEFTTYDQLVELLENIAASLNE